MEWAGLLRAAAAASVIKHNAWLRVLAAQRSASRLSVLCRIGYSITKGTHDTLKPYARTLDFVVNFVKFT